jgi:hypothetical protein
VQEFKLLKRLVREVAKLGAQFRIAGSTVEIDKFNELPGFLQEALALQQTEWIAAILSVGRR